MGLHKMSFEITGMKGTDSRGWMFCAEGHGEDSFDELPQEIEKVKARYLSENRDMTEYHRSILDSRELRGLANKFGTSKLIEFYKEHYGDAASRA